MNRSASNVVAPSPDIGTETKAAAATPTAGAASGLVIPAIPDDQSNHQLASSVTHHHGTTPDLTADVGVGSNSTEQRETERDSDTTPVAAQPQTQTIVENDANASVFSLNATRETPFNADADAPAVPGTSSLQPPVSANTAAPSPLPLRANNFNPSNPQPDDAVADPLQSEQAPASVSTPAPLPAKAEEEVPEVMRELHFQLIPFVQQGQPPNPTVECLEQKIKEGDIVRIGRKVVKNGVEQMLDGQKDSALNIWYQSKVVSRNHAEIWIADGQLFVKDVGSSSGTFLNKMRLSPSGKESRPYTLRENDLLVFGVDYKGKSDEDLYKCVSVRIGFYDNTWIKQLRKKANPAKFKKALKQLLSASNPHSAHTDDDDDTPPEDCCICIGEIAPLQAIFIAPCSHCFHYKCVNSLLMQSQMFQCPMCRQVANLAASVSTESLDGSPTKAPATSPVKPALEGDGAEGMCHNRGETAVPPEDVGTNSSPVGPMPSVPHHVISGGESIHSSSPSLNSQSSKFGWGKKGDGRPGSGKKIFGGLFGGKKKDEGGSGH
ncbi:UNVERIFIED_CONTAM: hypothetical protein HDU68_009433 [Siphonaria sp. JEL0065]|nr:hypothetical protein HDU68_009433 [Siphonaria sp. JEL0065]